MNRSGFRDISLWCACCRWLLLLVAVALTGVGAPQARAASAVYSVGPDAKGQTTITVTGQGASVTLGQIRGALGASAQLLENQGNGVWQLNANLLVDRGVTLNLSGSAGVSELRLRSQAGALSLATAGDGQYDYQSFVYLRTDDGTINIDGVKIYSWDPAAGTFDTDIANGRSYILAKYAAHLNINNADLGYLGSADGESYGVAWRDINDSAKPGVLRARVTGLVMNSAFHHNYYGVYTFQASGMVFRGNKFFSNLSYGFDPHDYSNNFTVEDNQAFANGSHGFIISRGCTNFIFRRNKSYNNNNPDPVKLAHGFMLDPGSPESADPQAPSHHNLLENNQAYDNEGYGLRILGSTDNVIRNNLFQNNQQGITVEQGSTNNTLTGNTISGNRISGIFVRGGADNTLVVGNVVTQSGVNGIYVKSNNNTVSQNTTSQNGRAGISFLPETSTAAALGDLTLPDQIARVSEIDPELLTPLALASSIDGNRVQANTVASNADDGIEIKGATHTTVEANTVERNLGHGVYLANGASHNQMTRNTIGFNRGDGIRANGIDSVQNSWSENAVFGNTSGGILVTSGANGRLRAPVLGKVQGNQVAGTAPPGAIVEIFSDTGEQGRHFEGRTTARADGSFTFAASNGWKAPNINAIAIDGNGNASAFTYNGGRIIYLPLAIR